MREIDIKKFSEEQRKIIASKIQEISDKEKAFESAEAAFNEAEGELSKSRDELAGILCPYKAGQIMTHKKKSWRNGKERVYTAKFMYATYSSYPPFYSMVGRTIKKDGTEGESKTLYEYDKWEPAAPCP